MHDAAATATVVSKMLVKQVDNQYFTFSDKFQNTKLVWLQRRGAPLHGAAATATLFWIMLVKPMEYQYVHHYLGACVHNLIDSGFRTHMCVVSRI